MRELLQMNRKTRLNLEYMLLQGAYWALYCSARNFGTVFLQGRGYSNSALGLILGVGPLICLFLSAKLAEHVDNRGGNTVYVTNGILYTALLVLNLFIFFVKGKSIFISLSFAVMGCLLISINPLNTEISLRAGDSPEDINYGRARGCGSLTYAVASTGLGTLVASFSPDLIPLVSAAFAAVNLLGLYFIYKTGNKEAGKPAESKPQKVRPISLAEFFRRYQKFTVFLLGVALIYFAHNALVTYMINIVRNLGAEADTLGRINALMAIMELPAMFLFNRICRRFDCRKVLGVAMIFMVVRVVFICTATSIRGLYLAQIAQALGFALAVPGLVRYAKVMIPAKDSAKAQSISFAASTLGNVLAGFVGGRLLDIMSISKVLLVLSVTAVLGLVISFANIDMKAQIQHNT